MLKWGLGWRVCIARECALSGIVLIVQSFCNGLAVAMYVLDGLEVLNDLKVLDGFKIYDDLELFDSLQASNVLKALDGRKKLNGIEVLFWR